MRVLIIDDNADLRTTLGYRLCALGYEVRAAADGPSGLNLAARFLPEVVLLDLHMPLMSGYETAAEFRSRPQSKGLRLVLMTGSGTATLADATHAGFDAFVRKPASVATILSALDPGAIAAG